MIKRNDGKGINAIQNKFTAFLMVAVRNQRKKYIERIFKSKDAVLETELMEKTVGNEDKGIEAIIIQDTIKNAVKQLTEREKKIFVLHLIEEKTFSEIGQIMGLTYKNTAAIFYRSMAKIHKAIRSIDNEF